MKPKKETWKQAGLALTFACGVLFLGGGLARGQSAPVITQDPTNQFVLPGSNAILSVAVSGTGPFTYQWQFNGTNLSNGVLSVVAGNGTAGYRGDNGPATNAELASPAGLAVDSLGNLYIADSGTNRIRKVSVNGIITTVAGVGVPGFSGDNGQATNARLNEPYGVALDALGKLFIADSGNNRIRKVNTNGIITTVAVINDFFPSPYFVTMDSFGNLFYSDADGYEVWEIGTNGVSTRIAGCGAPPFNPSNGSWFSGDGGPATSAKMLGPCGVAIDTLGDILIADSGNNRIREVGTNGIINTVAGNGSDGYSGDGGSATNAGIRAPVGLTLDSSGDFFISAGADVRMVATNGIITTVAGPIHHGGGSYYITYSTTGITMDPYGNLFISLCSSTNAQVDKLLLQGPLYQVGNMSAANSGSYDVVVTGLNGSVTSSVVTVSIALPAMIASLSAGQGVQFQFTGTPGCQYALQMATNLTPPIVWQPLCTNTADTNGNCCFTDTNTANPAQFYRAQAQ